MNSMLSNIQNVIQMSQQLRQNPMQFLGPLNIPQNISNNPQAILQHLMKNGVVSQDQYNDAIKTINSIGIKI